MTKRDEIRARLAAATPGPWATSSQGAIWRGNTLIAHCSSNLTPPSVESIADAALIARAPADLALLLEAVDRLAALVALLERGCEVGTGYGACCSRRWENAAEDEAAWLRANGLA